MPPVRSRPLLRPRRTHAKEVAFLRDLPSGQEAVEALVARGLYPASALEDPRRTFRRWPRCDRCADRRVRWDRRRPDPWQPDCPYVAKPCKCAGRTFVRPFPSRGAARVLFATADWLTAEDLGREFVARLRTFLRGCVFGYGAQLAAQLEPDRVTWRVVRRATWRPGFYLPRNPALVPARAFRAAFDVVWDVTAEWPPWVYAWNQWYARGAVTQGMRMVRMIGGILSGVALGPAFPLLATRAKRLPEGLSQAARWAWLAEQWGTTPHGLTLPAESMVKTALRATTRWPKEHPDFADPFEPLRAMHALGFAVHDVTHEAIELVCVRPARRRPSSASQATTPPQNRSNPL